MFNNKNCNLTDAQVNEQAKELLQQLSLEEKVMMLHGEWDMVGNALNHGNAYNPVPICTKGNDRVGITPIKFSDGPRGVVMGHSTCFPVSMARGASFDRDLEKRIGDVIGKECRAQDSNYFAGVCINLLRHPAWGRAQETYGEDPYHVGEFGKALTESVQEHNVMACLKHYALNQIENSRFRVDVQVDDRALREVYLAHFKKSVDAGAASLMGAYNKFDGDHACESKKLQTEILRDEWGFEGFTSSDFIFGVRNTAKAMNAGMDVEMPLPIEYHNKLLKAVEDGEVSEETLNTAVERIIRTLLVFENSPEKCEEYTMDMVASKEHTELAREAAEKSMVLIKNDNGTLPLNKDMKKVLVVGKLAAKANTGDHGSSNIHAPYVVTQLEGFKNYFGEGVEIIHLDEEKVEEAKVQAKEADCVIIIAGNDAQDEGEFVVPDEEGGMNMPNLVGRGYANMGKLEELTKLAPPEGEEAPAQQSYTGAVGGDRANLSLKDPEIKLIQEIGGINKNTVVTLIGGSMLMTHEWDHIVPAVVYGWYSGMEGGNALPRVLFGDVNPSGKLPFTIPEDVAHLPYFSSSDNEITYDLYHGYSKLDKDGNTARYPFGFGLSYTTFELSDVAAKVVKDTVEVNVSVKNTGDCLGAEVVQVYVGKEDSKIDRQKKLLKGFEKIELQPGESKVITVTVNLDELKYYDMAEKAWAFEKGAYTLYVGNASDEKALTTVSIEL